MNNSNFKFILTIMLCSLFVSCSSQNNQKMVTPDIDSAGTTHGYNYTEFGLLVHAPWEYRKDYFKGINIIKYDPDSIKNQPSTTVILYEEFQIDLVFELWKDGSLKYWFKRDYIKSPDDTITQQDGGKSFRHLVLPSSKLQIKKIYEDGSWKYDFLTKVVKIDFGKNNFNLKPIEGKCIKLNSSEMVIEEISNFSNNERQTSTRYFIH